MPRPSWNDIRASASAFAERYKDDHYEAGESQSFWTDFLEIFGVNRKRAGGYFEYAVKLAGKKYGFIDMFLPGKLLAEQKSAGRNLKSAAAQGLGYLDGITDYDLPAAVVVSDFKSFQFMDLETREVTEFLLADLPQHVRLFGFLVDEKSIKYQEEDPVNRVAAERMAKLHNELWDSGYRGHKLELFLVRLMFCHFADDANIFPKGIFEHYIRHRTSGDGTDIGPRLGKVFEVLNTPEDERPTTLDDDLKVFPYINGGLFEEVTGMPDFDGPMRLSLILTCTPDWSSVSPAIFGSMFQGVMNEEMRHELGAHYTSEENILRVVQPLFLDALYGEFELVKTDAKKLVVFHEKLASLNFLDPACGCGNFLVIAYRELRRLEHRVLDAQLKGAVTLTDVRDLLKVQVEQFHGIEITEFPALIAKTAMWLTEHQMNIEASMKFGKHYARIPLHEGANIANKNALTTDWETVVPASKLAYILGNPPFLGSRTMDKTQKNELKVVAGNLREAGFLDYVTAWYILADRFMDKNPQIEAAFVSTNSISQGEQPGIFWEGLLDHGQHINFAHRTFQWKNDARGVAAVHCVVIGFSRVERKIKQLFDYPDIQGEPILSLVSRINPYLVDADNSLLHTMHVQISGALEMAFGNMPADGGKLILSPSERTDLITAEPEAEKWVLPLFGAKEFINGLNRYCLWLDGVTSGELKASPLVYQRVKELRQIRLDSSRPKLADSPHLFAQITQHPHKPFLLIPRHSSINREYVPMGFFREGNIAHDSCMIIEDAGLFEFGILTSQMHMDWLRAVGGRLKSDYRYSKDIVYNNWVFPTTSLDQKVQIERLAQAVLDARAEHPGDTLADLYDPVTMPADLRHAHNALDLGVDKLYQPGPFKDAGERVALLFALHAAALEREPKG